MLATFKAYDFMITMGFQMAPKECYRFVIQMVTGQQCAIMDGIILTLTLCAINFSMVQVS